MKSLDKNQQKKLEGAILRLQGSDFQKLQAEIGAPEVVSPAFDVQICGSHCPA